MPLVEALVEMSSYAMFIKELVIKKRTLECEIFKVSHHHSATVTNNLVVKKEDPGAFTIQCTIGVCKFGKAILCGLRVSINLMSLANFEELGLYTPSLMTMKLLTMNWSIKRPISTLHNMLVKIDKFILSADFVILHCEVDVDMPTILGR